MALGNSSTNFNRKRSAYVLKRFFCDDLIPIGFETPQEHVGGAHGSQTSCFACHHKLDPMAGFFRSYGAYFFDYSRSPDIIFDDLANKDRALYEAVWKAADKTQPAWNIGYIRSARWQRYNSYGTSMADLSRILRTAPEVKRCLVKRLHEYVVAEDQTIDRGYLDYLTREFEAEAAVSSSTAVKNTIVRLLQSAAYEQRNADPKQCYDVRTGLGRRRRAAMPGCLHPEQELLAVPQRGQRGRGSTARCRHLDPRAGRSQPHLPPPRRQDDAAFRRATAWPGSSSACRASMPPPACPRER